MAKGCTCFSFTPIPVLLHAGFPSFQRVSSVVQGNTNTWIRPRDANGMEKPHGLPRQRQFPGKTDEPSLLHLPAGQLLMEAPKQDPLPRERLPWGLLQPLDKSSPISESMRAAALLLQALGRDGCGEPGWFYSYSILLFALTGPARRESIPDGFVEQHSKETWLKICFRELQGSSAPQGLALPRWQQITSTSPS